MLTCPECGETRDLEMHWPVVHSRRLSQTNEGILRVHSPAVCLEDEHWGGFQREPTGSSTGCSEGCREAALRGEGSPESFSPSPTTQHPHPGLRRRDHEGQPGIFFALSHHATPAPRVKGTGPRGAARNLFRPFPPRNTRTQG